MLTDERKHVWIDRFQTRLALRIGAYLTLLPLVLLNLLFAWRLTVEGVTQPFEQFLALIRDLAPVGVCLLIVMPVMAWDAIRFSHRLVGPIARFRSCVREVGRGEAVRPIKLRDGDYLCEFRDEFNQMLQALQRRGLPVLRPDVPLDGDKAQKTLA